MSRLNDIYSSYGKTFGMAVANTYSYNVINTGELPKNMLIISATENGQHSLFATDNNGSPVRLTYDITTGNGIVENNGTLSLEVDNLLFFENSNGDLSLNKTNIIDNTTVKVSKSKLAVDTQSVKKASMQYGVAKVDGTTIVSDNGVLHANTSSLDYSNNNANTFGTIKSSSTINANNGILSVKADNLEKATNSTYGLIKTDNNTVISNNGILSVNINSFGRASSTFYGISKPDDNSIYKSNDSSLKINYNALKKASNISFGVVKSDNITTTIDNGVLSIKNYSTIQQNIIGLSSTISDLDNRLSVIEDTLNILTPVTNGPRIFTFVCNGLSSVNLTKPEYGEIPEEMEVQKINASFIVKTNCPFKIAVNYIDNISPAISLYEINYNDIDKYPGQTGLTRTFQSTNENDVIISFSWLCKNYRDTDNSNYSTKTRIVIDVMYANDISVKKEVKYSIVRFNSLYNDDLINGDSNDEILIDNGDGIIIPVTGYRLQVDYDGGNDYREDGQYSLGPEPEYMFNKYKFYYDSIGRTLPIVDTPEIIPISINSDTSYTFRTNIPKINLYVSVDGESYVFSKTISRNEIDVSCSLTNNETQQVNNVQLYTNDSMIYFSYNEFLR